MRRLTILSMSSRPSTSEDSADNPTRGDEVSEECMALASDDKLQELASLLLELGKQVCSSKGFMNVSIAQDEMDSEEGVGFRGTVATGGRVRAALASKS